jgi:hypothetical protein
MSDHDSRALQSPQTTDAQSTIDDRDVRALTNPMTVLDDVDPVADELPAVAGERGVYLVVSHSGAEHVVDAIEPRCSCSDFEYRDVRCKHLRRVAFATGERTLPDWANDDAVDDGLGQHVRRVATDGGSIDDEDEDNVEYPARRGDSLDASIEDAPSPFPDEVVEVDVEVENAHLSLVADGVLQPARSASSSQRGKAYLPLDALHAAVRRALDRVDLALVEYRHATIDVPIENILDDEYDVNPNIVTVTFTVAVERPPDAVAETDGGTIATDAGEQLPDDVDPADVAVADTGAGLLVYVVEREYRSHINRETEVARELIGFADVEDWDAIDEAVRARGHGHGDVLHLPEFDVDELPDPVDGNGGDDR